MSPPPSAASPGRAAAAAVSVDVAIGVPERDRYSTRSGLLLCRRQAGAAGGPVGPSLAAPRRPLRKPRSARARHPRS